MLVELAFLAKHASAIEVEIYIYIAGNKIDLIQEILQKYLNPMGLAKNKAYNRVDAASMDPTATPHRTSIAASEPASRRCYHCTFSCCKSAVRDFIDAP